MKKTLLFLMAIVLVAFSSAAQGKDKNKNKDKGKGAEKISEIKNKDRDEKQHHENKVWDGVKDKDGAGPLPSKNQPAKVRAAFKRDYPNATQTSWTKFRGDWTATFRNGLFWSTAVYHANGERKDTRTVIPKTSLPKKIEDIFKNKPEVKPEDIIKIEVPKSIRDIFRIKISDAGSVRFVFYNPEGEEVQYDY